MLTKFNEWKRLPGEILSLRREVGNLRNECEILRHYAEQQAYKDQILRESLGRVQEHVVAAAHPQSLHEAEFKVFSQWGEDGIIQHILRTVGPVPKTFIEFGVETFHEANTRWLVVAHGWSGLVMDGSPDHVAAIKADPIYWKHNLKARSAFISAENINDLVREEGVVGRIGLLSIDIDGVDYWVWKAVDVVQPDIVVIEYNSLFGPERAVTVPYDPAFRRSQAHSSTSYYGASIAALAALGRSKGYALVGSNSAGNNAFFVRRSLVRPPLIEKDPSGAYVRRGFREARNPDGSLALPTFDEEQRLIAEAPLVEVAD